jgi:CRP-like cAMP-binding protein
MTALDNAQRLLGACSLFSHLTTSARSALVARARLRICAAGQLVFQMGSPGDSMMAVLTGKIRISIPSPDGKEITLAILQAGDVFGEIALLDGKERTADATAVTECSLAVLDRDEVLKFLEGNPASWLKLVEVLCDRLRKTDRQISELAHLQLPNRLAKTILRLAEQHSESAAEINLSQRELGNFVGASRESVNKCLRDWQKQGVIQVAGNTIRILKSTALEALASANE